MISASDEPLAFRTFAKVFSTFGGQLVADAVMKEVGIDLALVKMLPPLVQALGRAKIDAERDGPAFKTALSSVEVVHRALCCLLNRLSDVELVEHVRNIAAEPVSAQYLKSAD